MLMLRAIGQVHIEADRHFENGLQIIMIGHEASRNYRHQGHISEAFYWSRAPKMSKI